MDKELRIREALESSICHEARSTSDVISRFYSTENKSFYANYWYWTFDTSEREIRLIALWTGNENDPLECEANARLSVRDRLMKPDLVTLRYHIALATQTI